jgi:hypothetical protein
MKEKRPQNKIGGSVVKSASVPCGQFNAFKSPSWGSHQQLTNNQSTTYET